MTSIWLFLKTSFLSSQSIFVFINTVLVIYQHLFPILMFSPNFCKECLFFFLIINFHVWPFKYYHPNSNWCLHFLLRFWIIYSINIFEYLIITSLWITRKLLMPHLINFESTFYFLVIKLVIVIFVLKKYQGIEVVLND